MRFTTAIFSTVSALAFVGSAAPTAGLSIERSVTRPTSNIVSRPSSPKNRVRGQRRRSSPKNRVRRQRRQSDGDLSSKLLPPAGPVGKASTALLHNGESSVSGGEEDLNVVINTAQDTPEHASSEISDISSDFGAVAQDIPTTVRRKLNTPSYFLLSRTSIGFVSIIFNQRNR